MGGHVAVFVTAEWCMYRMWWTTRWHCGIITGSMAC